MAMTIVDLHRKNGGPFHSKLLVYQRVYPWIPSLSHHYPIIIPIKHHYPIIIPLLHPIGKVSAPSLWNTNHHGTPRIWEVREVREVWVTIYSNIRQIAWLTGMPIISRRWQNDPDITPLVKPPHRWYVNLVKVQQSNQYNPTDLSYV